MSNHADRLAALRAELARDGLDGFLVPVADEHGSEYVPAYAQRLAWLTGFDGSAGAAAVLPGQAALFVDGRYTLQASRQVDPALFAVVPSAETPLADWLGAQVAPGQRIGFDPWLYTERQVEGLRRAVEGRGGQLVAVEANPLDRAWADQPAASTAPLIVQPDALAGRSSAEKRAEIGQWMEARGVDAVALTMLDSVAWLFNVRGGDVARTPVPLAFAIVRRDGTATLFVDDIKLSPEVRAHLGNSVETRPRWAFPEALGELRGRAVAADSERSAHAVFAALAAAGARAVEARDPCVLPKAIKTPAEITGMRSAHLRDGAALTRFLHWLSIEAPRGEVDELTAIARLEAFRRETGALKDLSFDTIAGSGPNGAIIHYRATEASNRRVQPGELFLIDSGGQYADGTTDVTRTVAVGEPTADMRRHFTLVLKAHIALATAVFPDGARGCQLDGVTRAPLWAAGLDYAHGTGHGVGAFLAVHEGPARIASYGGGDEPLRAGMILSNEPGYYREGAFGIRIENLVLVVPRDVPGAEKPMLGFETLTLAPIERALVEPGMLTPAERGWLDAYHAAVMAGVGPQVPGDTRAWLSKACAPVRASGSQRVASRSESGEAGAYQRPVEGLAVGGR
jgi:Xaa-Pro aminopeptidase